MATRNSARIAANSSKDDGQAKGTAPPSSRTGKAKVSKADKDFNTALKDAMRQDAEETEAARRAEAELRKFLLYVLCARVFGIDEASSTDRRPRREGSCPGEERLVPRHTQKQRTVLTLLLQAARRARSGPARTKTAVTVSRVLPPRRARRPTARRMPPPVSSRKSPSLRARRPSRRRSGRPTMERMMRPTTTKGLPTARTKNSLSTRKPPSSCSTLSVHAHHRARNNR